jgi:serine/threonine protein kinase
MQTQSHILPAGKALDNGSYTIVRHLGSGGFGITYLAQNRLGRHVVIKEMYLSGHCVRNTDTYAITLQNLEPDSYQRHKERFRNEGLALLKFNHPNIVRVEELFEENGTLYLVMEYIDGSNLEEMKERRGVPFSVEESMRIGRQMVSALTEIHNQQVYHRDVKPANVMIDRNGTAKLIDFGISKQVDENITMTQTKAFSKYYAAPEQQAGAKPSALFDIYSLGGTLYFMLTGQRPKDVSERATDEFLAPHQINPDIPVQMSEAIMKALSLKPAERWQSIGEFGDALGGSPAAGSASSDDKTHVYESQSSSRAQSNVPPAPPPATPVAGEDKERRRVMPFWLKSVLYGVIITTGGIGVGIAGLRLAGVPISDSYMPGPTVRADTTRMNRDTSLTVKKETEEVKKPDQTPKSGETQPAKQKDPEPVIYTKEPERPKQKTIEKTGSSGSIYESAGGNTSPGFSSTGMSDLVGQWSSKDATSSYSWNFGGSADGGKFTLNMTQRQDGNITVYFKISGMWQKTGSNTISTRYGKVNCNVDVDGERFDLRNMEDADLDAEERGQLKMLVQIMDALEGQSVNYTVRINSRNSVSLTDGAGTVSRLSR